jgi:hypothetical protein
MFYSGKEERTLAAAKPRRPTAAKAPCPPTPFENWCKPRALPSAGEKVVCGGRPSRPPSAWALKALRARVTPSAPVFCQRVGKFIGPGS